jgi:hypothetical protein
VAGGGPEFGWNTTADGGNALGADYVLAQSLARFEGTVEGLVTSWTTPLVDVYSDPNTPGAALSTVYAQLAAPALSNFASELTGYWSAARGIAGLAGGTVQVELASQCVTFGLS